MFRPNRRRILKIGIILIIASLVLFSVAMVQFSLNTSNYNDIKINPGSSLTFHKNSVLAGDDLEYSVESSSSSYNISSYLLSPSGSHYANQSSVSHSVSEVIIPSTGGNWTLVIVNNDLSSPINVSITYGQVGYITIFTTVFGFVLLPSGIALIGLHAYASHSEKKRNRDR